MFYNAEFNQYVNEGTTFTLDGIQYPPSWLNQSTPEQKAAIGLVEVQVIGGPANQQYYWVSENLEGPILTYTNIPKDLIGVQESATTLVNTTAYSLLFPSDWMVTKAVETQTPVPEAWNTYRAQVRATANTAKDALTLTTTVEEVEAIILNLQWPHDPNWVVPVIDPQPEVPNATV